MESFVPPKDPKTDSKASERALKPHDGEGAAGPEMVADKLLAALASGNLEYLEQARQAFVAEPRVETSTERKPSQPAAEFTSAEETRLHEEEEALRRVEQELEQRRAQVRAA